MSSSLDMGDCILDPLATRKLVADSDPLSLVKDEIAVLSEGAIGVLAAEYAAVVMPSKLLPSPDSRLS